MGVIILSKMGNTVESPDKQRKDSFVTYLTTESTPIQKQSLVETSQERVVCYPVLLRSYSFF